MCSASEMARLSARDVMVYYSYQDSLLGYGSAQAETSSTGRTKSYQGRKCNYTNSSRLPHVDLSTDLDSVASDMSTAKPSCLANACFRMKSLRNTKRCSCNGFRYWCLLIPVPIVVVCVVSLINKCNPVHFKTTSLSGDVIEAARFNKSCHSLAIIESHTEVEIEAYSMECSDLATRMYSNEVSFSESHHELSKVNFGLFSSDESYSNYFAGGVSSEIKLTLSARGVGEVNICHFTNYTCFWQFLQKDKHETAVKCQSFNVYNTSDSYEHLFTYNTSTYYFVGMSIKSPIDYLHYNFMAKRSYFNESDFTDDHGKPCHIMKGTQCNISLPHSNTCLMIHTGGDNMGSSSRVYREIQITGVGKSGRSKYIATIILCLLVMFYLLYLYTMVCLKFICNQH